VQGRRGHFGDVLPTKRKKSISTPDGGRVPGFFGKLEQGMGDATLDIFGGISQSLMCSRPRLAPRTIAHTDFIRAAMG
jgi:hypothetical protein